MRSIINFFKIMFEVIGDAQRMQREYHFKYRNLGE